jgi:cytochrome c biogenesis protein CcdA
MSKKFKFKYSWNRLRFYLGVLLLLFYLVLGFLFIFTNTWSDLLPDTRFIIGISLIIFGIFRFYVSYRRFVNKKIRITLQKEKNDEKPA